MYKQANQGLPLRRREGKESTSVVKVKVKCDTQKGILVIVINEVLSSYIVHSSQLDMD